jgi:selenocysteine lyase/cysteine desulfurase
MESLFEDGFFNNLRLREYDNLDQTGQVYLDYTGGNLYPNSIIDKHFSYLKSGVYGNPHSTNPSSQQSTIHVDAARQAVLDFFNAANDYYCVFTANASAALQIVGECYPFNQNSMFLLTADNHNSVNGIREYCVSKGGKYEYVQLNYEDLKINQEKLDEGLKIHDYESNRLFAFPAQSNVSGIKHPLSLIQKAQDLGWDVLLDAAAFVPTSKLDLAIYKPDFVSVSFYKIFGYPTGIGCLLVKKEKFNKLKKPWFAGGTVTWVSVNFQSYFLTENHERFENGTVNYLDIPAIKNGLDFITEIGIDKISQRIKSLSSYIIYRFENMVHKNGEHLFNYFGTKNLDEKGGTFIFNVKGYDGKQFPFQWVEHMANQLLISVRTGCFCNPGIDEVNSCVTNDELSRFYTSRDHGSYSEWLTFVGKIRGAIRLSVGIATTKSDLDRFFNFVFDTFADKVESDFELQNVMAHT